MCIGWAFLESFLSADGDWDVMNMTGAAEERAAIQLVMSTWLRKTGDKKNFGGYMVTGAYYRFIICIITVTGPRG
jgi:hypothetical protein